MVSTDRQNKMKKREAAFSGSGGCCFAFLVFCILRMTEKGGRIT